MHDCWMWIRYTKVNQQEAEAVNDYVRQTNAVIRIAEGDILAWAGKAGKLQAQLEEAVAYCRAINEVYKNSKRMQRIKVPAFMEESHV